MKRHEDPRVSVLIPAFNPGVEWLRQAVVSILEQSLAELEVIVIDDGSTDGSVEACKKEISDPRVLWHRQENAGKAHAMNVAIELAKAPFLAVQDADDWSHPLRLEKQLAAFDDESVGICFCGYECQIGERITAPHVAVKPKELCRGLLDECRMPGHDPTIMLRRSALGDCRYATELPVVEGLDLILQVAVGSEAVNIGGPHYVYRIHADSITKRRASERASFLEQVARRAAERSGQSVSPGERVVARATRDDNYLFSDFATSVKELRDAGRYRQALCVALDSVRIRPTDLMYYKPLAQAVAPQKLLRFFSKARRGLRK